MTDRNEPPHGPGGGMRDLHDTAIQRLFSAELSLLSTLGRIPAVDVRERIRESVAVLDLIIHDLRSALHADTDRPELRSDGTPAAGRSTLSVAADGHHDDGHARVDGDPARADGDEPPAVRRASGSRARAG